MGEGINFRQISENSNIEHLFLGYYNIVNNKLVLRKEIGLGSVIKEYRYFKFINQNKIFDNGKSWIIW